MISALHLHLFNFLYRVRDLAHVGLRDGGPVFRAQLYIMRLTYSGDNHLGFTHHRLHP